MYLRLTNRAGYKVCVWNLDKIDTGDAKPVRQAPYRTTPKIKKEIDEQLDKLLQKKLIRKKYYEYRMAIDYRMLNAVTNHISYPLPRF